MAEAIVVSELSTHAHVSGRRVLTALGLAVGAGILFDIGLRGGFANALVAIAIVLAILALVAWGDIERIEARCCVFAALVPAVWLVLRASPWLAASNAFASIALVAVGVAFARSGSVTNTNVYALVGRALRAVTRSPARIERAWTMLPSSAHARREPATRALRATAISAPILLAVVLLLASADPIFAALLTPDLGPIPGHLLPIIGLSALVFGLSAASPVDEGDATYRGRLGALEIVTMLSLAAMVLGLFVASQLVSLTDAGRRLVNESGFTPAEYTRSGFFQLCWATALLLAFIALVRALAAPGVLSRPLVRTLAAGVPVLALGLVAVSLRRMALYDEAFGLTMLRLWVVGAALWMGSVLMMTALRNAGVGYGRRWLVAGSVGSALALLLIGNAMDPEAFIVRHNVQRAQSGAAFDADYLSTLSDDATPAIADAIKLRVPRLRALRSAIDCTNSADGVAALNLAAARARDARADVCAER